MGEAGQRAQGEKWNDAPLSKSQEQQEQQREEEIELFFNGKRPCVQEGCVLGGRSPVVARFDMQVEVGNEDEDREELCAEGRPFLLVKDQTACCQSGEKDNSEGGKEPPGAAHPEVLQGEGAVRAFTKDDGGDQEAGDHKEDINSHEPSGQEGGVQVIEYHGKDRHGPQAVDIRTVSQACHDDGRVQSRSRECCPSMWWKSTPMLSTAITESW